VNGRLVLQGRRRRFRLVWVLIRLAPWLLLVAGTLLGVLLVPRYSTVPMFVAAPLIAAPFYSMRAVLFAAVLAPGCVLGLEYERGFSLDLDAAARLATCFTVAVLALLINRVVQRSEALLASAREIAVAAQSAVLPEPMRRLAGLDLAAHYEAAQAGAFIGGDFYAAQDTPHGARFVLGDVRGKGLGAVAAVGVVIGAFREAAEQETTLEAVAQRLDRALAREATLRHEQQDFEEFATAILVEVPHSHETVRVVNRGHPTPLLLQPDGSLDELTPPVAALPLGMTDLGAWPDRSRETAFPPGTMLLLFTDGLTEARDPHGVFYDPVAALRGRVFDGPETLLTTLMEDVRRHTRDGATDDLALMAVRRP
jgi:serine phosphatase RsbU (regulator of sigma subunit)